MKFLTKKQILLLHEQIIKHTGGVNGIRDEGLLDSAINNPLQTFTKMDLYPSIEEKAIRLCYSIIKNHPFLDGNKRIGLHCLLVTFAINKIKLNYKKDDMY